VKIARLFFQGIHLLTLLPSAVLPHEHDRALGTMSRVGKGAKGDLQLDSRDVDDINFKHSAWKTALRIAGGNGVGQKSEQDGL
jgi:hypothetical protein